MNSIAVADVVAVFKHSHVGQFLLALVVGYCLMAGYKAYRNRRDRRFKPSPLPFTEFEMRSIPGLSPRRTWDQPAAKGFEHRRTVVDLAERRQSRQVH